MQCHDMPNPVFFRLGHTENYSFSLELETAIAEAADEASNMLTNQIV